MTAATDFDGYERAHDDSMERESIRNAARRVLSALNAPDVLMGGEATILNTKDVETIAHAALK